MKNLKSNALRLAHQIKAYFSSWSQAVKAGWILAKLNLGYAVNIQFAKKDTAEVRKASAIALGGLSSIAKGFVRFLEQVDSDRTQWRSFRISNLILN